MDSLRWKESVEFQVYGMLGQRHDGVTDTKIKKTCLNWQELTLGMIKCKSLNLVIGNEGKMVIYNVPYTRMRYMISRTFVKVECRGQVATCATSY